MCRRIVQYWLGREADLISGPDEMALPAMVMGADAAFGSTYNIMPGIYLQIVYRWDLLAFSLPSTRRRWQHCLASDNWTSTFVDLTDCVSCYGLAGSCARGRKGLSAGSLPP